MKKMIILLFIILGSCSNNKTFNIEGFWKVDDYKLNPKENIRTYYCEIGKERFLVWDKSIDYLPPFKYSIIKENLVLKRLKPDGSTNESDSLIQGKLIPLNQDLFYVVKKEGRLEYRRILYEDFFDKFGQYWINDPKHR